MDFVNIKDIHIAVDDHQIPNTSIIRITNLGNILKPLDITSGPDRYVTKSFGKLELANLTIIKYYTLNDLTFLEWNQQVLDCDHNRKTVTVTFCDQIIELIDCMLSSYLLETDSDTGMLLETMVIVPNSQSYQTS